MNLPTIEMAADSARKAYLDYWRALKRRRNDEDEQIMRAYRALSKGQQVISLRDVMAKGGQDEAGLPKLAIARADESCIVLRMEGRGGANFCGPRLAGAWAHSSHDSSRCFSLPQGTFPSPVVTSWVTHEAMVPLIPPALRPLRTVPETGKETDVSLSNYHILWEAEWKRVVPRDPALLKRLSGDLFAVVAVWDLTDVERLVLGDRLATR